MAASDPLLYIDFEGRGIKDTDGPHEVADQPILEVGAILISADLSHEYGRYETVIRPTAEALDDLRSIPFVYDMHVASGLYAELTGPDAHKPPALLLRAVPRPPLRLRAVRRLRRRAPQAQGSGWLWNGARPARQACPMPT